MSCSFHQIQRNQTPKIPWEKGLITRFCCGKVLKRLFELRTEIDIFFILCRLDKTYKRAECGTTLTMNFYIFFPDFDHIAN